MVARLPAFAHIRELRLCIRNDADEAQRPFTLSAPYGIPFREIWGGQILLAPVARDYAHALSAFLEALDGRVTAFVVPLGRFSHRPAVTATLNAVPDLQDDSVSLNLTGSGYLEPGTLISVGDPDSSAYQVFETVAPVSASGVQTVYVAPRVRCTFSGGAAVRVGDVLGKFKLANDTPQINMAVGYGLCVLDVVEAL